MVDIQKALNKALRKQGKRMREVIRPEMEVWKRSIEMKHKLFKGKKK